MKHKSLKLLLGVGFVAFGGFATVAGAESDLDNDGVPKIDVHGRIIVKRVEAGMPVIHPGKPSEPNYQDREFRVVTVRGKDMSLTEFVNTYCLAKERTNPTCARAVKIANIDRMGRSDGKLRLPPGL